MSGRENMVKNKEEKSIRELVVTNKWNRCADYIFWSVCPKEDRFIVKSLKQNKGSLLLLIEHFVDKLKYLEKKKEWDVREIVFNGEGEMDVIKIMLEKKYPQFKVKEIGE